MAYPVETPSRIWRRIKEGEAREADMPSLPSLPDLDDSGVESPSLSLPGDDLKLDWHPSGGQLTQPRSTPAVPRVSQLHALGTDPTPLPSVTSLLTDISDTGESHDESALLERRDGVKKDDITIDIHRKGDPEVPVMSARLQNLDRPGEAERCALSESILVHNTLPSSDYAPFVDVGMARIDVSQKLDGSGKRGSLRNVNAAQREPRGVELCEPCDPNRQSIKPHPLQSQTPPTPSLPSMSNSRLLPWSSDVDQESAPNSQTDSGTMHASSMVGQGRLGSQVEECSDTELGHDTVKTTVSREPTFSSEDAESTRGTVVRFSEVMSFPAGLATPALPYELHAGRSRYQTHPENNSEEQGEADDLATPLPRRKSFLLSVVNSSIRPRLAMPTPHPRAHVRKADTAGRLTPGPSGLFNQGVRKPRLSVFAPFTPLTNLPEGTRPDNSPEGVANSSFVSTASSHDLTVHHRANASFDPLTGPQGVGRFNAGKLNTYLHGLNRRLQEENELLVNRVRTQQSELEVLRDQTRHRELSGVIENDAAEQWIVEKESLEQNMHELERLIEAKDKELADERALRARDKETWKGRMAEVEDGVGQIVADLERRIQEADMKAASLTQRAEEAELMLLNLKESGSVFQPADATNSGAENVTEKSQAPKQHAQGRSEMLVAIQASLADKEREATSLKGVVHDLETSLRIARETIEASHHDAKELRSDQRELKDELRTAQAMTDKLKSELSITSDRIRDLEKQLLEAQGKLSEKQESLEVANERITLASEELERAKSSIQQLEAALEESDKKILSDNKALMELRSRSSAKECESRKEGLRDDPKIGLLDNEVDVGALQAELANATKEIGRLTAMLDQNPARRALDKARESRIDLLEKENQELLDQLRAVRDAPHCATPHRTANMSGLSPMQRRLINLSLRAPRTPGEPLRNASWLMSVTAGDFSTAQLVEEIGRLQRELDLANESVDDKLDKLEEAGLGVVGLTKALEEARRRIVELESVLDERESRPLGRYLCSRCGDNEKASPDESLQLRLAVVTAELESLRRRRDEEMESSSGEKAVLRDATNRLNLEIKRAKEDLKVAERRGHKAEKSKAELQQELAKTRKTIDDLEFFLQSERNRLRTMSAENSSALKERQKILEKLYETEQRMEQARDRIFQLKEDNIKLEAELKVQRKTTSIEEALIGNRESIGRLRRERLELSDRYYELQQQLAEASKNASELATKHAKLQLSYDGRRRQLDRQAHEIEVLRAALSSQAQKLEKAQCDKENTRPDSVELRSLACKLEYELKRIQQEANSFGRDLVHLRAERDELIIRHREELEQHERTTKQIRSQLRSLKQQLANRKEGRDLASEIQVATEALRIQHNRECKGLFVQIRYLQAKYTREAALRDDLGYQKGYLIILLSRFQESEKRILATIAQIGSTSTSTTSSRSKTLRTAVLAVIFISRARRVSDAWREQRSACSAVAVALDNVRKNRALKA